MRRLLRTAAAVAGTLAFVGSANAGLLPSSWSVTPENDQFRWTYAIVLPTDTQLQSGDYFTIYDFNGFVAGSNSQPTGWTFSTALTGPTPNGVIPSDNATIPNLTWTYTGPTISTGQVGLGNFWATSTFQTPTDAFFTAITGRTSDGLSDANITSTKVPVPGEVTQVNTPEPATIALAGLGLPLVGWGLRRRRAAK